MTVVRSPCDGGRDADARCVGCGAPGRRAGGRRPVGRRPPGVPRRVPPRRRRGRRPRRPRRRARPRRRGVGRLTARPPIIRPLQGSPCSSPSPRRTSSPAARPSTPTGSRVVDEPDQPARSLGALTFAELAARAARSPPASTRSASRPGERVAVVSQNSARMLDLFYGATASRPRRSSRSTSGSRRRGRLHRRAQRRVAAARRPRVRRRARRRARAAPVRARRRERRRAAALRRRAAAVGGRRRERHRDDQLHERHDRAAEGRASSPTATSGSTARCSRCTLGVTDRDVYLHTLPMFHANGWSLPFALAALGVPQIVLRKVDGPELLRRIERHGVTFTGGAPAVLDIALDAAADAAPRPPRRRAAARPRAAARRRRPARSRASRTSSAGSSCRSTASPRPRPLLVLNRAPRRGPRRRRRRAPPAPDPRRRARARRARCARRPTARCSPAPTTCSRATGAQPEATADALARRLVPHRRRRPYRRRLPDDLRPQEGHHHHGRGERRLDRGREPPARPPGRRRGRRDRRPPREVGRDRQGDRGARARGARPDVDTHDPDVGLVLHLSGERAGLFLDLAGEPLRIDAATGSP